MAPELAAASPALDRRADVFNDGDWTEAGPAWHGQWMRFWVPLMAFVASGCSAADGSGGSDASTTSGSTGGALPASGTDSDSGTTAQGGSETTGNAESSVGGPSAALEALCEAAATYVAGCGDSLAACSAAELGACFEVFGIERDEFIAARAACGFADGCFDPFAFEQDLCVYQATQAVAPTAVQSELADALCAACMPDDPACLDDFFFVPEPMKGSSGVGGIGSSFLQFDDEFVAQLLDRCVPDTEQACVQAYLSCREQEIESERPASVNEICDTPAPD